MDRFLRGLTSRWLLAAAFALGAPVVAPAIVAAAYAQAGVQVVGIEFEGNKRYSDETLRLTLRTKVGQKLDRALLPEDISALYQFFDSVDIREEQSPEGVRITFVVTENPPVTEVAILGADGLDEGEVRSVVETAPGRPLADFRLENDKRKVERLYKRRGYHFVQVGARSEPAGDGRRVVIEVLEGPRVSVDTISFEGAKGLTKEQLLSNVATQESGFLGLSPADYVEETLRQDLLTMRNFYRSEGWLDAQVTLADVEFSADREDADVKIRVVEGAAYTVGDVRIEGVQSYPGGVEGLRLLIALQPGRRKRHDEVLRALSAIERAYREEGFFAAVVTPEERVRESGNVVDLTLRVEESSKVRVRALSIHGNVVTQDKVLRRNISLAPGDVLNQNEIDKSIRRLQSLAYFDRVQARVEPPAEGDDPNQRDVTFEVDDTAPTGQVRFAFGVSSDVGLTASVAVTKRNFDWRDWPERFGDVFAGRAFTGAGQTFRLEIAPGSELSAYRLGFTEPWLFDKPINFSWDLFLRQNRRFEYDSDQRGINFTLGRRWTFEERDRDLVLGLNALSRIENYDLDGLDEDSPPTAFLSEGSNSLISERLTFRAERVDSTLSPTEGWYAEASAEFGFAGDVQLWKPVIEAKRYFLLGRNEDERPHVLSVSGRLGYVDPLGGSVEADPNLFDEEFTPIYERFLAGGGSSVRGFEFGGAGPHGEGDPFLERRPGERNSERLRRLARVSRSVLENSGDPMGGQVQLLTSVEYTFPLYENLLRGVVFVDAGMVRESFSSSHGLDEDTNEQLRRELRDAGGKLAPLADDIDYDDGASFFSDVRVAVGFGLRIRLPFFGPTPIALDFGIPVRDIDGDDTQVVSFSIARDF